MKSWFELLPYVIVLNDNHCFQKLLLYDILFQTNHFKFICIRHKLGFLLQFYNNTDFLADLKSVYSCNSSLTAKKPVKL